MKVVLTVTAGGCVSLPANLRKILGIKAGDQLIGETTRDGLVLRPCVTLPIEIYTQERIAEFDAAEQDLGAFFRQNS